MPESFAVAVAGRAAQARFRNREMTWSEFCAWQREPRRTPETAAEYAAMPKAERSAAKDGECFVAGFLEGGSRGRLRGGAGGPRDGVRDGDLARVPAATNGETNAQRQLPDRRDPEEIRLGADRENQKTESVRVREDLRKGRRCETKILVTALVHPPVSPENAARPAAGRKRKP